MRKPKINKIKWPRKTQTGNNAEKQKTPSKRRSKAEKQQKKSEEAEKQKGREAEKQKNCKVVEREKKTN